MTVTRNARSKAVVRRTRERGWCTCLRGEDPSKPPRLEAPGARHGHRPSSPRSCGLPGRPRPGSESPPSGAGTAGRGGHRWTGAGEEAGASLETREPAATEQGPTLADALPPARVTGQEVAARRPRDVEDPNVYHSISLVAFLAWVGLGADGLSSSAYGPDEAFRALGEHHFIAVALAAATAVTVLVISVAYSQIIKRFPFGGGGYVVATRLLGPRFGVVSGSALLVDYILTISISIAAAPTRCSACCPLLSSPTSCRWPCWPSPCSAFSTCVA